MAGLSNAVELKVLDHLTGKTSYTSPGPLYLALVTTAVGETDTGATIVEAGYTGYARKQVAIADWNAASAGASVTNAVQNFAACTAGTSVVIGYALCSSSGTGTGDVVCYGTCTSVTINNVQTPASVASGALSITAD